MLKSFLESRLGKWKRLEELTARVSRLRLKNLSGEEVREFGQLYRRTAADLAIAREEVNDRRLVNYLNYLVGRAHGAIYRSESSGFGVFVTFFRYEFPAVFRKTFLYTFTAFLTFTLAAGFASAACLLDEGFADRIAPQLRQDIANHHNWTDSINGSNPLASTTIQSNNITVTFFVFAGGVLAGIGTLWALVKNGLLLGMVLSLCFRYRFWEVPIFVSAHGVIELTAIFIAGGAGLLIGKALLMPGDLRRIDALVENGRLSIKLILGCIPMLLIAGLIEGFISPAHIPAAFKFSVSAMSALLMTLYFLKPSPAKPNANAEQGISGGDLPGEGLMKKALIAASIPWLCLFPSLSQTSSFSPSARSPAGQTDKTTERHAGASRGSDLKSLYETHQWFKLRDAVQAENATAFYRGAVAYAFNDLKQAEKHLQDVIKSAPKSEQASEARGLLIYVYQRAGRYRRAMSQIQELLAAEPDNANLKNARSFFAELSQYPEQSVTGRHYASIRYRIQDGNLFVPLSVDGKSAEYILDTGANFSTMSESEARRLGLTTHESAVKGTVATGAQVGFRTAVADRLTVGNVRLRHVVFLVARDDQQPFVDLPPGERGALGLPVLLAMHTMRWSADGTFESAFRSARSSVRESNLCFEGADAVTEIEFRQSKLNLHLDTGASETVLFPKFAEEFANVLSESGKKESKRVTGVGDTVELDAVSLPLVSLRIGGFDAALRPARVLLKQVGSRWLHGRLGLDLLSQARVVTIDFRSMRLALD